MQAGLLLGRFGRLLEHMSLENADNALNKIYELVKRFEDRLTLGNLAFAKRYVDNHLNLFLEASWGAVDFNTIIQRKDAFEPDGRSGIHQKWHSIRTGAKQPNMAFGSQEHSRHADLCIHGNGCGSYDYDGIVFVDNVEPMKRPKADVQSIARFQPKDQPLGAGADAL